jgi:ATP-dependent Clp protease adaptor protein ClpS
MPLKPPNKQIVLLTIRIRSFWLNLGMEMDGFSLLALNDRMDSPAVSTKTVTNSQEEVAEEIALETVTTEGWNLVLYNDEHNTFDHVIEMLISICEHEAMQAEQCALMVHFKGKCSVLSGTYDELEPKCSKLLSADLTAEIEA